MAGVSVTDTFNTFASTTLRDYRAAIGNNIFKGAATLMWLESKGRVKRSQTGGREIALPVEYAVNDTMAAMSGYDQLDTTPQETLTTSFWPWRYYAGTASIAKTEELQNKGESQLINLVQYTADNAMRSLRDKVATAMWTDAASEPAKAIFPIPLIIDDGPTSTVGTVSGSTYSWWQNYQADVGAFASNLYTDMLTAYNTVSRGSNDFPDTAITTQTGFEYLERFTTGLSGTSGFRVVLNTGTSETLGFDSLKFKSADVFWDAFLASGTPVAGESMYFINTDHFEYYVDPAADFSPGEFMEVPALQHAKVAKLLHASNFATNARWKHGVIHGIDAS